MGIDRIRITRSLMFIELTKHLESILNFVPSEHDILICDDVNEARRHFAPRHFAPKTKCPEDILPQDILPQIAQNIGRGTYCPNSRTMVDILPQLFFLRFLAP